MKRVLRPLPPTLDPDIIELARAIARAAARRDHAREQDAKAGRNEARRDLR